MSGMHVRRVRRQEETPIVYPTSHRKVHPSIAWMHFSGGDGIRTRKGFNIFDTWRIEDGAIVEHWDSLEPIDLSMRLYFALTGGRVRNPNGVF